MSQFPRKWSVEMTKAIIQYYELQPVLYKVSSPNYHNKVSRYNAIQTIKQHLEEEFKVCLNETEILKKINNLRSQFLDCLRSQRKQSASGSGANSKSVWWLFESMQFLLPYCNKDKGTSSITQHISSECNESGRNLSADQDNQLNFMSQGVDNEEDKENYPDLDVDIQEVEESECLLSLVVTGSEETPTKKSRKRKQSGNVDDFLKDAINDIVKEKKSAPPTEIESLSKFIESEFALITNRKKFKKLKWEILNLIRAAQDEDED